MKTRSSAELRLTFSNPRLIVRDDNTERAAADARLVLLLDDAPVMESKPFPFVAPIGLLEADDLKWYLESYYIWPVGLFKERAERIEQAFPQWGVQLLAALTATPSAQATLQAWLEAQTTDESVFSIDVLAEDTPESRTATSRLLAFPWELLNHDGQYWLAHASPVRIRRNIPVAETVPTMPHEYAGEVVRILAVSPRPSAAGYFDHRASIKPLLEAVEGLGNHAELVRVHPATIHALAAELRQAKAAGKPFHVLHFDGHGVFDASKGKGALCFEDRLDNQKRLPEIVDLVYAAELATLLSECPVPLVFLEACQTAQSDEDPNASVAASLLQAGVTSVIAMSHSVLIETARRFVGTFYQQLAAGQRIGTAVLEAQKVLMQATDRINITGVGTLHMQDWFVPVLYQRDDDPRLFSHALQVTAANAPEPLLGELPETPPHTFIGRSRELLAAERLLEQQPYAVIRGQGGIGKTTLAVELARWLVQSHRFDRCAFVSVESYAHDRAVLDVLGRQLIGEHYSVAEFADLDTALQPLLRVLENERVLIVVDNMESLLADAGNVQPVLQLLAKLLPSRLLFTTREPLPAPFNHAAREITLGALSLTDAKALVMQVMNNEGLNLRHDDQGKDPSEVNALVEAVGCHARALVLLARELAREGVGVKATTEKMCSIMQELERKHPSEREKSLFASVELSLRRLSPEVRGQIAGLAVFHDGGDWQNMQHVLEVDNDRMSHIIEALIQVGLAQWVGDYSYLRLDPALPAYLDLGLTAEQRESYQQRWQAVRGVLVDFLHQQYFEDTQFASQLTQLELPNIIAYLQRQVMLLQAGEVMAEQVIDKSSKVEQLLANLHHPLALAKVLAWRKLAVQTLSEWSQAQFVNEKMAVDRLLQRGDIQTAVKAAKTLLQQCERAGPYVGADYDLAMATKLMGQVLTESGAAVKALPYFQQAQTRFEQLGERGVRMAAVVLVAQGNCLRALGKYDAAAAAYEEAIQRHEKRADTRAIAIGKNQLATIRLYQHRYTEALQGYREALRLATQLDEQTTVAGVWHQIGIVHRQIDDYEQAEQAFRHALSINSQQGNRTREAASLNELGNLYDNWNSPEQAVNFYRQAADLYRQLGNLRHEGGTRSNLANVLIQLKRYNEARSELQLGVNCLKVLGHTVEPWKMLHILHNLEQACGNHVAAWAARQQAVAAYLAYRRDGGENHEGGGRLCFDILQAIKQRESEEFVPIIEQLLDQDDSDKNFLHKLQAILAGERDLALAEDEGLRFELAVELLLLLEGLREAGM